jgi:hypothetical protein
MSEHEPREPEEDERSGEERIDESGRNPTQRRIDDEGPDLSAVGDLEERTRDEG